MEEKDFLEDYEMRTWQLTPRIYKIFGIAAVLNFLVIFALGQFNMFTTRGCDTPYVGMVCQVLDSAYVASVFMGKDTGIEDIDEGVTDISDADITYIDVSEKLEYPAGYFALANPEQTSEALPTTDVIAGMPSTGMPSSTSSSGNPFTGLPTTTNENLMDKVAVTPTPNKAIENQEEVKSPFEIASGSPKRPSYTPPRVTPRVNPRVEKTPKLDDGSPRTLPTFGKPTPKPTVQKTPPPTPTPTPIDAEVAKKEFDQKVNKAPFTKLANDVVETQDDPNKKVDLTQPFTVILDGTLTQEGKFDPNPKKTTFVKSEGNQQMQNLAKSALEALGDSKIFGYLQLLGVTKVNIVLTQDDKQISAVVKSNQPSEESAKTVSSGLGGWISIAKINNDDADTQALLKAVKLEAKGKSLIINFAMPKDQAHQMIDKKLGEARQKKSQPQPNDEGKQANAKGK